MSGERERISTVQVVESGARQWRTRKDPFAADAEVIEEMLGVMPDLQALELLHHLQEQHPGRYEDGQLRTLQRRLQLWGGGQWPGTGDHV